ncbi:MAG: amidohydrolase [Candidatus Heimdallarchaeota archaeon]|nr:MAG: amidohydrolase [Candidatus Heimdallarchaeota archaeon]
MSHSEADILIFNAHILTINNKMESFRWGYIIIKNSKIIDIGSMDEFHANFNKKIDVKEEIDAKGDLVFPGFVNAHGHFAMTLFRGIADDLPLMKWLKEYIWPIEAKLQKQDCYVGTQLAAIEMIQGGTTTACDMYFNEDQSLKALEEIGFRGVLGHGMIDFGNEKKGKQEISEAKKFIELVKSAKLCTVIVSPHATNTCSDELLIEAKKLAEENKLPLQIHLAETKDEVDEVKKKKNCTPTKHLNNLGFLCENLVAGHCVWLNAEDIKLLKENNVKISHNPSSNLKLGSGIFNYQDLAKSGITIALGTDGASSNNNLSMIEELRLASLLHKGVNTNPEILPASEAIRMATINGAKALGLENEIGSLEIGKKADLVILNTRMSNVWPPHDPYSLIAYCANDSNVKTTIINGQIVLKDRQLMTIDSGEVLSDAKESLVQILNRVNLKQYNDKKKYLQ